MLIAGSELRSDPYPSSSSSGKADGGTLRQELEIFFVEVNGLANCLKKTRASLHQSEHLPPGGRSVLQLLGEEGVQSVPQIARLSFSSRQNIQIVVNRLHSEGWVELIENPAHKRSPLVQLTELGKSLLASAAEREEAFWARLPTLAVGDDLSSVTALLRQVRESLTGRSRPSHPDASVQTSNPILTGSALRRHPVQPCANTVLETEHGTATIEPMPQPSPALPVVTTNQQIQPSEEDFPVSLL
jgi:DNA-binding MarR family transcriptional regulator